MEEDREDEASREIADTSSSDIRELDIAKPTANVYPTAAYAKQLESLQSINTGLSAALAKQFEPLHNVTTALAAAHAKHFEPLHNVTTGLAAGLTELFEPLQSINTGLSAALAKQFEPLHNVTTALAAAHAKQFEPLQRIFATSWKAAYVEHLSVFTTSGKLLAERIAHDVVADTLPEDPQWRDEFNKWISDHFWSIICWSIAGIMTLLLFLISASAPELEADYDSLTRSPITIISLALSVYALSKQKKG